MSQKWVIPEDWKRQDLTEDADFFCEDLNSLVKMINQEIKTGSLGEVIEKNGIKGMQLKGVLTGPGRRLELGHKELVQKNAILFNFTSFTGTLTLTRIYPNEDYYKVICFYAPTYDTKELDKVRAGVGGLLFIMASVVNINQRELLKKAKWN